MSISTQHRRRAGGAHQPAIERHREATPAGHYRDRHDDCQQQSQIRARVERRPERPRGQRHQYRSQGYAIAEYAHRAGFRGQALTTAVAIALAESGGNPAARGDTTITNGTWGPSIGLWQVRSLRADNGTGHERDAKANLNPATNARHA